jgi:hypothetical protein
VNLQLILSIFGGLFGLTGLSLARRKIAQAVRRIRPKYSIQIIGPPAAGKTTLFRYLRQEALSREPTQMVSKPRAGRIATDLMGTTTYFALSTVTDGVVGEPPPSWTWWQKRYNPHGLIVIIDTHQPEAEHAYFQELYERYRAFSSQTQPVNLRVLLILLNKFDLWGRTAEARETMINHYRRGMFQDLVDRFRSSFGVTVQWGSASLTQPEHAPYNNVILREFLMAVAQKG